ncbi:hypothetical protein [Streptomyces sp. NPDC015680]|uniref:hypothetical protein n=1 Tax=unclassified Streptomyces TaxID=2593676 RepID=UPI0036F78060
MAFSRLRSAQAGGHPQRGDDELDRDVHGQLLAVSPGSAVAACPVREATQPS